MFGTLGGPELFLILVIALIIFGPRKLPEVGRSVGKMLMEFRRASTDFKRTIEGEIEAEKAPPAPPRPSASEPASDPPGPEQATSAPAPEGAVPTTPSSSTPPAPPESAK